jgi:lysophospholipase L1-like esterase
LPVAVDVNTIGAAIEQARPVQASCVSSRPAAFGRDLRTLLAGIKSRAPGGRIVWLNLANFAALPYAASYTLQQKRTLQDISVSFSAEVNALRADGAIIVDVMCDPAFYEAGNYSSDGFHPNDAGYAHLADLAYPPATTGQGTAPQASCSQMTRY